MIALAHMGDLHLSPKTPEVVWRELERLPSIFGANDIDALIIAGDVWDREFRLNERAPLHRFGQILKQLSCPVLIIYGNHDPEGSLEPLLEYCPVDSMLFTSPEVRTVYLGEKSFSFGAVPYPRFGGIVAHGGTIDEMYERARMALEDIVRGMAVAAKDKGLPYVLAYHGTVAGVKYNEKQTAFGRDILIGEDVLRYSGAAYVACAHIHKPQTLVDDSELESSYVRYCGSFWATDYGDEQYHSIPIVEIEGNHTIRVFTHDINVPRPMKIRVAYEDQLPVAAVAGRDLWVEVLCTEEQAVLCDDRWRASLREFYSTAESVRVTLDVQTASRARVQMLEESSLGSKVKQWGEITGTEIHPSIIRAADEIERICRVRDFDDNDVHSISALLEDVCD